MGFTRAIAQPSRSDMKLPRCVAMRLDKEQLGFNKKCASMDSKIANDESETKT